MKGRRHYPLWRVAVVLFCVSLVTALTPSAAHAVVSLGDIEITFTQLVFLLTIAAAWGDMRQQVKSIRERLDKVEERAEEDR